MKRLLAMMLTVLLCGAALTACATPQADNLMENVTPNPVGDVPLSDVDAAAVTDFAVRLFRAGAEEGENTLISPLSVLVALAMTANGAEEETLAQMEAVLGMPVAQLNSWIHSYMTALPTGEKYKLSLANSVWCKDSGDGRFTVNEDFLQINADYYAADIFRAPFDESTCREINDWVEEKTDGMIRDILDGIPESVVMYLVNALAFDAEWQEIYEKSQIREGNFTTEDGAVRRVEMMYADEGAYLEDAHATGFIKYYADRKYAFAALLPEEGMSVAAYLDTLSGTQLSALLSAPQFVAVETAIPKFETEYSAELGDILRGMGMTDALDPRKADLGRLGESTAGNIYISRVLHKTYINVDGKGTRAGAATVVEADTESCLLEAPKRVYLNRPFVYMLIDCERNLPFFIGTMMDTGE